MPLFGEGRTLNVGSSIINALPIVGGIFNGLMQGAQNKKNRKFAEHMYDRQRLDAIADRTFENEYNSPAAQMARLKAGGLNPNLVYGNGATAQGESTRSSSFSAPQTRAPEIDSSAIMGIYDAKMKQAQTDNIAALTKVAQQEALLKAVQTTNIAAQTEQSTATTASIKQNTSQSATRFPVSMSELEANVKKILADTGLTSANIGKVGYEIGKIKADTTYTLDSNERARVMQKATLSKMAAEILKINAETKNVNWQSTQAAQTFLDSRVKYEMDKLDLELKRNGIQPHDAAYWRILQNASIKANSGIEATLTWLKQIGQKLAKQPRW